MSEKKGLSTGSIVAITLGSVVVIGGVLFFVLRNKSKAQSSSTQTTAKSNKPKLSSTPLTANTDVSKNLLGTLTNTLNDALKKALGGGKGIGGSSSTSSPSGKGGSSLEKKSNANTGWVKDSEGYWKDPSDGRWYWENEDGTLTDKETGDIYDPTTGEWLGIDYGDGSWSDADGRMYVYNEEKGTWEEAGWVYDDGSWSYDDGSIWDYDENGNEVQIGSWNDDGTWTDNQGYTYYENGSYDDPYGNYYSSSGELIFSEDEADDSYSNDDEYDQYWD